MIIKICGIQNENTLHCCEKNKLDGVVCSPKEIKYIRREIGKNFIIVTPGIRINNKIKICTITWHRKWTIHENFKKNGCKNYKINFN